ncbi:MAG: cupin domain-containing protein [Betaproteobacteria bacterium]|nr:cupin domain-containing protein [Betaproteobacteria bacterium]
MKNTKPESPISNDMLEAMLAHVAPVKLIAARNAAMKKSLLARLASESSTGSAAAPEAAVKTLRMDDTRWKPLAPKVDMQILLDDGFTASWLARVAPGGRIPAHEHTHGQEEFLVMSGTCTVDGASLKAGDFQIAAMGTHHIDIFSAEGCMLFIKSPSFKAQRAQPAAHARA